MGILRFLLAISVVLAHSKPIMGYSLVGGQIAVQVFFIISGFYMSLILNEKYINENDSYKLFISNRLLRLFPSYLVVLLLVVLCSGFVFFYTGGKSWGSLQPYHQYSEGMNVGSLLFLAGTNIMLFGQDLVSFLGLDVLTGNLFFTENFRNSSPALHHFLLVPQAWTIGVELTFYLLAPFIVRRSLFWIIPMILLSLGLRAFLYGEGLNYDPWTYRFFPTEIVFFLLGNVSYRIYTCVKQIEIRSNVLAVIFVAIVGCTIMYHKVHLPYQMYFYFLLFFITLPFVFKMTKKWKWDTYIGELSYPIYISHIFVLFCIGQFNISLLHSPGVTLTIFTLLFSMLLNYLVTARIEKFRQKRVVPVGLLGGALSMTSLKMGHE